MEQLLIDALRNAPNRDIQALLLEVYIYKNMEQYLMKMAKL